MGSTFVTNIGPGNTIGAVAVGSGATAEGTVTVGGHPAPAVDRLRVTIDIRGAASIDEIAAYLDRITIAIGRNKMVGAIGNVSGAGTKGCAWKVEADE